MEECIAVLHPLVIAMPKIATSRSTETDTPSSHANPAAPIDPWEDARSAAQPVVAETLAVEAAAVGAPAKAPTAKAASVPTGPSGRARPSPLRDSPALSLILMLWFAFAVFQAIVGLTIELVVVIFTLIQWVVRRYQVQQEALESSAPMQEQLATTG